MSAVAYPGLHAMTALAEVDQLATGGRPSKFFEALDHADRKLVDLELSYTAFARSVGTYPCTCGKAFEFPADGGIDDFAALNRWLGVHSLCPEAHPSTPGQLQR